MAEITISVPEESVRALGPTPEEFRAELRLAAAMMCYQLGRLSSSAAAKLAGIPRVAFLCKLADYGIDTFRQTEEELEREVDQACGDQTD